MELSKSLGTSKTKREGLLTKTVEENINPDKNNRRKVFKCN